MTLEIAVIGGGIVGVSSAVKIIEHYNSLANVTLISEIFTPQTTGDGSAGLWGPYLCGSTSPTKIAQWSEETHEFLKDLWLSNNAAEAGVCLLPVLRVTTSSMGLDTFWKNIVYGCQKLSKQELQELSKQHNNLYTDGVHFTTFTSEPVKLLPFLMKRFQKAGGKIENKKIMNLYEFVNNEKFNIVINCTGLGSKYIIPDDEMYSIRGQVIRVNAPWVYYVLLDESDDGNYIIPNCDSVVLGGTHQINDYNTSVDNNDSKFIYLGCQTLIPGLKNVKTTKEWVGLRPGRPSIRMEKEIIDGGKIIIHNYGHGGSGVTLAWGCASEVLKLIANNKNKL